MAVLPILRADDPILRRGARRVKVFDQSLRKLAGDMVDTMHAVEGVGLAAPQVGVSLRLAVVQLPSHYKNRMAGKLVVLCNPHLLRAWGEWRPEEGCLSFPGYAAFVARASMVLVRAQDTDGRWFRLRGRGTMAQALQHEIDHLNGVLFFDYLASPDELIAVPPSDNGRDQT